MPLGISRALVAASLFTLGALFPLAAQDATVNLQFKDSPLPFILAEYEKLKGKRIIRDANVDSATLSIETNATMTKEEAARFIEASLLLNGFVLVPSGPDSLKIITEARTPRSEGVPVILRPEDLPEGDQLVTFVMPLTHVRGEQVVDSFRMISPSNTYGEITVLPDGATLAITDNSAVIRNYIELQEFVDVPTAEQVTQSFPLLRSDALEVVEQLKTFLLPEDDDSQGTTTDTDLSPESRGKRMLAPRLAAIERTNRILVQAHPTQMLFVEQLITEFDAPSDTSNFLTRPLHYLSVLEFLPIAQDALNRGRNSDLDAIDFDEFAPSIDSRRSTSDPFSTINSNGLSNGSRESLGEPSDIGGPRSLVVGNTLLIGDPTANELFVSGPPEHLDLINRLADQFDKKPRQIFLSTVIGQLTLGDEHRFGVDFVQTLEEYDNGDQFFSAGSLRTRNPANGILDPQTLTSISAFGGTFPTGLTLYGQIGDHITAVLEALEQTSRFSVLSRPSVFTLNSEKAVIQTGQRIAVPVNTLSSLNTGTDNPAVASSIQYQDVVLRLEVIPLINSDDEVTLEISQVNDDIVGSTVVSGNEIPTIGTQEMRTTVIVPNKSTVLLGGLISEDRTDSETGVPLLTKIPVVKKLTGSTSRSSNREELLIFIQPHIVSHEVDLAEANADTMNRASIRNEALEFATSETSPIITPPGAEPESSSVSPQDSPKVTAPPAKKKRGWGGRIK